MDRKDWYEAGDQIKKIVQDAVESKDFAHLSNTIADVVEQAVDGLQDVLDDERIRDMIEQAGNACRRAGSTNSEAAERIRQRMKNKKEAEKNGQNHTPNHIQHREPKPVKVQVKVPGEISGRIMKWYGFGVGSMLGIACGIVGITALSTGLRMVLPFAILGFLAGAHFGIGVGGNGRVQMAKRFRRYREVLGERTHCLIEELADSVGKNARFVQKDLRRMIGGGYFKEGYMDQKGTMLITDRQTYQHYLTAQTEYAKREQEKKQEKKKEEDRKEKENIQAQDARSQISQEHRELLAEGERYIRHVHECNDLIPGDEMSAKLDRLEMVITRIFREAQKNPDVIPELKKMMSYYLPTTRKLLDAYCELDAQPIQGPNVENTKKEIETALDTVNNAFENLLDSLFEETAWDISTDISVLNTMLAQEGLTGTAFDKKKG